MSFPSLIQNKGITSTFTARLGNMTAKGILTLKHTQLQTQLRKFTHHQIKLLLGLPQLLVYLKIKNKGRQIQELTRLLIIIESYLCILPPIYIQAEF